MTVYGYRTRTPEKNYFADIRHPGGAAQWAHVRTNMGRKVAYAMIAKHFEGCKIEAFRDEAKMTAFDREGLAQGSDGHLVTNHWARYSSQGESYATAR